MHSVLRREALQDCIGGIARHRIADYYRRRQNRPVARGGTDAHEQMMQVPGAVEASEPTFTDDVDSLIYRRALELVRAEFENRTGDAFWKTAVDGRPRLDVADDLGMTALAVYNAKSRVLRRLRQELGGLVG